MITYDTLYQIDSKGNTRVWYMEQNGGQYRAISGIEGGNLVRSEWKTAIPKNVGRSNATTAEEQAAAEIAALYTKKRDRKYHDSKTTIGTGSKIIEPMLAEKYQGWAHKSKEPRDWMDVFCQPKLDGMRCIATRDGLFSRGGKAIVSSPHISEALEPFFKKNPDVVLDGELYNHEYHDDFNEIMSLAGQKKPTQEDWDNSRKMIQYHIYDTMNNEPFHERDLTLMIWFGKGQNGQGKYAHPSLVKVETLHAESGEELDEAYASFLEQGYEGQMVRLDHPYQQKRSKSLLKRKEFQDEEFPVDEIIEGRGNWAGFAKSIRCHTADGVSFQAGIKGNQKFTKELLQRKVKPKYATVRYQNKTPDGSLRFPIAVMFYDEERDT